MNTLFKQITLSWRLGTSYPRHLVGRIYKKGDKILFQYIKEGADEAKKEGFNGYPGIPIDWTVLDKEYENIYPLFEKRLISFERTDTKPLLDFWEINPNKKDDSLYLLAMTQGKNSTDNFEFLASFSAEEGLCFVTDIAGLSHTRFDLERLKVGNKLKYKKENIKDIDPNAISVYFKEDKIGYIKKGHSDVFNGVNSSKLNLEVKAIINKQLFVKVFYKN